MNDPSSGNRERLPHHGPCFVCGPENPNGLGLDWYHEEGRIQARFRFEEAQQGPRAHAHGGAAAAVLDEAMGAAAWWAGHRVLAANLSVDFRSPVPLEADVEVEAWVVRVEGRKVWTAGRLALAGGGALLTEATGLFVATPEFFGDGPVGFHREASPEDEG
jgi:acyl-coenzyme A thioesterase PaaI-like protein